MTALDVTQPIPLPRWGRASVVLLAAAIYLLLGVAGLAFAVGAGYASPIFPAAGFAVAVMLWSGGRAGAGLWLGSFLLNFGTAASHGDLTLSAGVAAAAIGGGAVLQAAVARWLVLRSVGYGWQRFEYEHHIVRALLLAGPLACLIGAVTGVCALYAAGLMPGDAIPYSLGNWWMGDTLGVLVVLPLSLTAFYRDRLPWRSRVLTVGVPMVAALLLVGAALHFAARMQRTQQQAVLAAHGQTIAQLLDERIVEHEASLSALSRLIEVTADMSAEQFEYFTRITLQNSPDIFALSNNYYVLLKNRAAFERSLAIKNGQPDFQIREKNANGALVRAGERPAYVAIGFIAPLAGNAAALGYDVDSEPVRHDAVLRAVASARASATAPLQLVQENRRRVGVLLLQPARFHGTALTSRAEAKSLAAFAVAVIKVEQMMQIATRSLPVNGLVFQVDDSRAPAAETRLYRSSASACSSDRSFIWRRELQMADRTWTLSVCPTPEFFRDNWSWIGVAVGGGGLVLAALLQILLLVSTGRTSIFQRRVSEQTTELDIKGDALEDHSAQINAVFSLSPDAFVVFAPDGSIRFVNPAFEALTGIPPAVLLGRDERVLLAELRLRCEHPEALASLAQFFRGDAVRQAPGRLVLQRPRHTVLQVVGIHASAPRVARILYFHEVTREAEVDRMKSEFLSHAAHELRTPLTIILGYSELLLSPNHDEGTRRELQETIHRQSTALVGIVNELLDLARIESRQGQELDIVDVEVTAIVRNVVADLVLPDQRLSIVVDLPVEAVIVRADPAKLGQALLNILANAIKFSPQGGEICVGLVTVPGRVGITIADQGIGMTADELARFGDRFWRADASGTIPGTGLGVSIVKEILTLMEGSLEIKSESGVGTTLTLWLRVGGTRAEGEGP